jgi:hypothetical protein
MVSLELPECIKKGVEIAIEKDDPRGMNSSKNKRGRSCQEK